MVMVCADTVPLGSYPYQKEPGFYMDEILKANLDVLLKNIKNDWDFTIIISGRGQVRVGKSTLGQQIGYYWTDQIKKLYGVDLPFNVEENYVFNGADLIKKGNKLGQKYPNSVLVYDEAGETLDSKKVMSGSTKNVLDYLRECGQYNMLNILILPDFFDMPKGIAIARSFCLIDVSYEANDKDIFERGFFRFYSLPAKKNLYLYGKKTLNYGAARFDFRGEFKKFEPLNKEEYRAAKIQALKNREKTSVNRKDKYLWFLCYWLNEVQGYSLHKIADMLSEATDDPISHAGISLLIQKYKDLKGL